jgi:flavin-dependent dehydrogenase
MDLGRVIARFLARPEVYHAIRGSQSTTPLRGTEESPLASPPDECDVLVVGGGPAGSTAATLLARRGWSVTLIEKDRHPRFHIGESLLPMNLPILERLGVLRAVERIGVLKRGADFPAPTPEGYNVFRFERAMDASLPHAFQVRRDEFDQLLFDNAAGSGVHAFQDHRVASVELGDQWVAAAGVSGDGRPFRCRARYLVDASGRDTLLGNHLRIKHRSPRHQSAALFAHFRGVERRPGADAGNVSIYRFDHGWVWLIPLRDGIMSIGAVCWPDYLKQRRTDNREFLLQTLRSIPALWQRMEHAEIVGNLHVTGNYSYACDRMAGHRWIMAGDSYAFVDPVFSSGVYFAMHAAEAAAGVVDGALRAPATERTLQRRYQREIRHGLRTMSWFIYRFTAPAMRKLFAGPRNILQVEQAMISMLSGDFYRDNGVLWRLQFFKLIYWIAALGDLGEQGRSYLFRRRQARALFSGGTTNQDSA